MCTEGIDEEDCCIVRSTLIIAFTLTAVFEAEGGVAVKATPGAKAATTKTFKTNYYALVIGNNEYRHLPKLKTAVNDAKDVSRVLTEKYGFKAKRLLNAGRRDILTAINEFRKSLGENDSFLIYYAGHGEYDKISV